MNNELEFKREIGHRIEGLRKEMNMTKDVFSKKIGITPQYLGIVEKGESTLSYCKLKKLCDFTGKTSDFILFGNDIKVEEKTKLLLSEFSYDEIQKACEAIKQIAIFLKERNKKSDNK